MLQAQILPSADAVQTQELMMEQEQARTDAMGFGRATGGAYTPQNGNGYGKGRRL